MNIVRWCIIVVFILCLKRDISWVKDITVKRRIRKWEVAVIIVCLGGLAAIVILFAREPQDYLLAIVGILEFMVTSMYEGISEKGLLVGGREGLHLYSWSEMKRVVVKESDVIKIEYVDIVGAGVLVQIYSREDYDKIKNVLNSNGISMEMHKK